MIQLAGRQFINFGSNDYLGLAADEKLVLAVQNSVSQLGFGSGASPLVNGRGTLHRRLEAELAKFEGRDDALLFSTGYAANIGTIGGLAGKPDVVFSDALNHASIIDGCKLCGANVVVYPHRDTATLKRHLQESKSFRRRLIVTDSLFSMDGDFAPLPDLCDLADQFDAMLMVDEAHATGVFGASGKGLTEHLEVSERIDAVVGTLSKALGCVGGFVAGNENLIKFIHNRARSYVFSTAFPEPNAAAALAALDVVRTEPERRIKLHQQANFTREFLTELGFSIGESQSQIIPILLGDADKALRFSEALLSQGVFLPAIRPPSVADGTSRLRISLSSVHRASQLETLQESLENLQR